MSTERRIKEEPDLEPGQAVNSPILVEHEVMVYIKKEPPGAPRSNSEGSDVSPTSPQNNLQVEELVVGSETLQQSAGARAAKPDVDTVRVKQEVIDQEDLTQEISPDVVFQIKVERIDDAEERRELEISVEQVGPDTSPENAVEMDTSPGAMVVQSTAGCRRSKRTRTQPEVRDDSAAKVSTERRQKAKENGETSTKKRIKRQPGPHLCDVCNKEFKKANKLTIHKRTHTGEKPYTCNICHKQFSYSDGFKGHLRTHTGEKPYVCQTCNKGFGQWSTLKDHELSHTGERPYSCEICNKAFARLRHLSEHQLVHTEIKQYSCELCKKEFKCKSGLKKHERMHIDEKLFPCGICNKNFATPSHLREHERTHTRKRRRYSSETS
ncbi:zinc finger protein 771-like isoform X1 [Cydia strobilella]|uniref:zinc finger protein 771-like isoform X1 n=1 Tax=Cydia strobilella TaxID=1100964 RepID=UPI003005FF87